MIIFERGVPLAFSNRMRPLKERNFLAIRISMIVSLCGVDARDAIITSKVGYFSEW